MASLAAIDSLNIIGYYGEMELPLAERKVRIVMAEQLQGTVEKYYDTVRTILSDERTSKRKKDILLAAAVLSLKNAYLSIFDKYYSAYINAAGTGGGGEPYSGANAWKRRRAYDFALWITQTARREPNLAFSESHAAAVTRTEVNAVCNLAAMDAAYRQGKRFKTWKTFGDLKVRPTHKAANGQRVPLDMPFTVGGYEMMFPNDSSLGAPAGEVVNCRCVLEFDDGKHLTNGNERGIMKTGSGRVSTISAEREQEYGVPYGAYAVNADMEYINSNEFAKKFKNITENKVVNETLLQCARKAIEHRNGTLYEDMYLINGYTGEIIAQRLDMTAKQGISHNDEIDNAILNAHENNVPIIAFHSHPEGFPPSIDDYNAAYDYGYTLAVVAGHNGQVYIYSNEVGSFDNVEDIQIHIKSAYEGGYDVDRAYLEAYDEIGITYRIAKE